MLPRFFHAFTASLSMHFVRWWREYIVLGLVLFTLLLIVCLLTSPPARFPVGDRVVISPGSSLSSIATGLKREHVIRSVFVFKVAAVLSGKSRQIHAGSYQFDTRLNELSVVYRVVEGITGIAPIKLTFPEGSNSYDMALLIDSHFSLIPERDFLDTAREDEGYLFPDTYFFPESATLDQIIHTLRANFDTKVTIIEPTLKASGHSVSELVTMASLLEGEAKTPQDRRIVSGILWHRIAIGMPLQVDAVFSYIFEKAHYVPTLADLKISSPYNTYLHTGLPPGPIDNPGEDALLAAAEPAKSNYLYYLTGTDGNMHYAATFEEHQANKEKYLK